MCHEGNKKVATPPKRWLDGTMDGTLGEVAGDAPATVLDVFPSARALPDAVRASKEAVQAAQLAARARHRRETWQARALVGGMTAMVVIGGLVVWPRIRAGRTAHAAAPVTTAVPSREAPANEAPATIPAPGGLLAAGVATLPAVTQAAPDPGALEACRDSYVGKRWRTAAAACATAFAARADDAKLALRVAEAEYARDHLVAARDWAQRTLALDAKEANALAVVGLSEQRSGHAEAAARAFRSYLALAPRGWLAAEARAALRGDGGHARRSAAGTVIPATEIPVTAPLPFGVPAPAGAAP
jgi:hypothetical protein